MLESTGFSLVFCVQSATPTSVDCFEIKDEVQQSK